MLPFFLCSAVGAMYGVWVLCNFFAMAILSVLAALVSTATWIVMNKRGLARGSFFAWIMGAIAVFFAFAAISSHAIKDVEVAWDERPQAWVGEVYQVVKNGKYSFSYDVELTSKEKGQKVRMFVKKTDNLHFQVGDRIAFWTTIQKVKNGGNPDDFDYHYYLLTHYISGVCYVNEQQVKVLEREECSSFRTVMLRLRQRMVDLYQTYLETTDLSIVAALTLGDKSMLQPQIRQAFSNTGTSHILALSGLHMGLMLAFFNIPLRLISKRGRVLKSMSTVAIIVLLWLYVLLAGGALSLVRSACMLSIAQMGAAVNGAEHRGVNNLSLAGLMILLFDPLAVFDVGFQLSFVAVFAIIVLNQYVWNRFQLPEWFEEKNFKQRKYNVIKTAYNFFKTKVYPFVCVSISAQWGTFPLVAYYFHTFSPYAVIANFVVIPVAYILLCSAMFFFLLPFAVVRSVLALCMGSVVSFLVEMLQQISLWPLATIHVNASPFLLLIVIGVPVVVYLFREYRGKRKRKRLLTLSFVLFTLTFVAENVWSFCHRLRPCVIVYKTKQSTVGHFIQSSSHSCLFSTVSKDSTLVLLSYVRRNFWKTKGFVEPSFGDAPFIAHNDGFYVFRGKRILALSGNVRLSKFHQDSLSPTPIDLLIVTELCRTSYSATQSAIRPRHIVLSQSLPRRLKAEWQAASKADGIACWDIEQEGAYVLYAD